MFYRLRLSLLFCLFAFPAIAFDKEACVEEGFKAMLTGDKNSVRTYVATEAMAKRGIGFQWRMLDDIKRKSVLDALVTAIAEAIGEYSEYSDTGELTFIDAPQNKENQISGSFNLPNQEHFEFLVELVDMSTCQMADLSIDTIPLSSYLRIKYYKPEKNGP